MNKLSQPSAANASAYSLVSAAEAILFACGDAIPEQRLADALRTDPRALPELMDQLNLRYQQTGSALHVMHLGDSWQLATRQEYADFIRAAMEQKKSVPLSSAALEVLTIIAYNQPVSKGFVEHVRGVDSSSIVNNLVERELLEEAGRLDVPGKPVLYRTTENFLRCFGLSSIGDLPALPILQPELPDAFPEDAAANDAPED